MKQKNLLMHQKSKEQLIDWAKAALKRQQDWQLEVHKRWEERQLTTAKM